jgi:RNA polymerase sigma-70 factor (ECF subfamily)
VTSRFDLDLYTPRLRRYARGLVAGQPPVLAEDLVRATLASRSQIGFLASWLDIEVGLYTLLTRIHRDAARTGSLGAWQTLKSGHSCAGGASRLERTTGPASQIDMMSVALGELALEEREALLLVVVEGFSYARSARILKVSRRVLIARLSRARMALSRLLHASVPMRTGKPRPTHLRVVE